MNYTVYETSTGDIICTGSSNVSNIDDVGKLDTQTAVEGTYPPGTYRFIEGVPTAIIENALVYIRSQRKSFLLESDWTQTGDCPLSDSKKIEWANYRQLLRDLPSNYTSNTNLDDVVFPTPPA
jgi:hypothetical protein|tara:strand:- start:182 stop:550 length:369 start_codon:yes stop_codon:yes gene_type:complete